ncbi:MAG: SDR family NAD(P)-dependent oxidoreductase [Sphingomonas bacterium]
MQCRRGESVRFDHLDFDTWKRMFAINADAVFHCCKAALDDLVAADRGRIVTIASSAGLRGYPDTAAYGSAIRARWPDADDLGFEHQSSRQCGLPRLHRHGPGRRERDQDRADDGHDEGAGQGVDGRSQSGGRLIQPAEIAALVVDVIKSDRKGEAVPIE